jgi:2-polyprenyl-3-methyl-5-hydroxy-6-metoxy-1,4-benzoquinol methylase
MNEREKYQAVWNIPNYGSYSPGLHFLPAALKALSPHEGATFIDIGSGSGKAAARLQELGYRVTAVDIAYNANSAFTGDIIITPIQDMAFPERFDYGICCDVMEHVPADEVPAVLSAIAKSCHKVFFQIANYPDSFGAAIGQPLHLTVKPVEWWGIELDKHFSQVSITTDGKNHQAVCS